MKTIKTKEIDHHISTLDKKKETKFFDRRQDINEKQENEFEETNGQRYAINKVVNRGKITTAETAFRGKQYVKRKVKEHGKLRKERIKTSDTQLEIKTRNSIDTVYHFNDSARVPSEKKTKLSHSKIYPDNFKVKFTDYNPDNYSKKMKLFMLRKHKNKVKNANKASSGAKRGIHEAGKVIKGSFTVVRKTVTGINNLITFGSGLILLIVITLFIGVFGALSDDSTINSATLPLNDKVIAYRETI